MADLWIAGVRVSAQRAASRRCGCTSRAAGSCCGAAGSARRWCTPARQLPAGARAHLGARGSAADVGGRVVAGDDRDAEVHGAPADVGLRGAAAGAGVRWRTACACRRWRDAPCPEPLASRRERLHLRRVASAARGAPARGAGGGERGAGVRRGRVRRGDRLRERGARASARASSCATSRARRARPPRRRPSRTCGSARSTRYAGSIVVPPHCGAELLDVIDFSDASISASAMKRRIAGIRWRYDRHRAVYEQRDPRRCVV